MWNPCWYDCFQKEDGIRDLIVTGVQTCALPIYQQRRAAPLAFDIFPRQRFRRFVGFLAGLTFHLNEHDALPIRPRSLIQAEVRDYNFGPEPRQSSVAIRYTFVDKMDT